MTNAEGITKPETGRDGSDPLWDAGASSVVREDSNRKRVYDLRFGEAVIDFAKAIP